MPAQESVQDSFTGTATGTTILIRKGERYAISLSGFGTATVQLQRQLDGTNWRVVDEYTADVEADGIAPCTMLARFEATAHSSGTIVGRIQT